MPHAEGATPRDATHAGGRVAYPGAARRMREIRRVIKTHSSGRDQAAHEQRMFIRHMDAPAPPRKWRPEDNATGMER